MARIRGESGPRFTFDAHRSRERFLRARATRVGAGFRESVEERAGSVLFWWIRLTGTVEQVYGLCGNIYLKRPLRYGRTELSVRPRGENNAVKDGLVGRLGFRKCRVSQRKSPKLCAKKGNTSSLCFARN